MADPSWLHLINMTAPSCAATFFSSRPERATNRKVPSVQLIANVSGDCFPVEGNHDILVEKTFIVDMDANFSLSEPHLKISLSSLQDIN
jgi:hypothetical protein